jgi:SAM-dependent methyltransferase
MTRIVIVLNQIISAFRSSILFDPIWLAKRNLRREIRSTIRDLRLQHGEKWLDVGCGLRPYEHYFPHGSYVGVDIRNSGRSITMKEPDYFYDGEVLPFQDEHFDGAINTQVLEHVKNPQSLLNEINRVLRANGTLIVSTPFAWEEHEIPYDFFRYSRFGMSEILTSSKFDVVNMKKDSSSIETIAMLLNTYIINSLTPAVRGSWIVVSIVICFPIQVVALCLSSLLPDRGHLYLNLITRARKNRDCSIT